MRMLVCLLLLCVLAADAADAQRRRDRVRHRDRHGWWDRRQPVEFGVRAGNDFDEDVGSAGAQLRVPLVRWLSLVPSGDVFFGDAGTEWQANGDLMLQPAPLGGVYLGTGAGLVRREFDLDGEADVEAGYNLLLGLDGGRLLGTLMRPFVEARWTEVEDYDPFRLVAGINVPIR